MEQDVPHSEGVAFMVSRTEEGALLDREPSFLLQDYYGHFSHKSKENKPPSLDLQLPALLAKKNSASTPNYFARFR